MSTNIVRQLLANLEDKEYRDAFVAEHINRTVAFQIRATREAQVMTQTGLAEKVGMAQARVSLLEDPNYGNLTINTLKRAASALDVALVVRFVPFTQLAIWAGGEPQVIPGLSSEAMEVPEFAVDIAEFNEREAARLAARSRNIPSGLRYAMSNPSRPVSPGLGPQEEPQGAERAMAQTAQGH